jgi:NADP-dependent aldehyde dehydrogenase
VDPRTRSALEPPFHNASAADIDHAVTAAAAAFRETRRFPAEKIAGFLDTSADEIEALGDALIITCDRETGLGAARLTGERARTTNQLRAFAALLREGSYVEAIIDTALPDRQPAPRPDIRRMLFPIGPVAVFGASNFPLAFSVAGGDTASAFAAGCPVIVKAHPSHPATSEMVATALTQAVRQCGFPDGFFSLLQGNTVEVGQTLIRHPDLAAVGFTGSLRGGRALFDTASQRPKPIPVYAEMGSTNPVVILPDAIKERTEEIATGLVNSINLGAGQFCTNPGLVFLMESEHTARFVERVNRQISETRSGTLLNAGIESALVRTVSHTVEHSGVTVTARGEAADDVGYTFPATILTTDAAAFQADEALQVEHFGPVSLFVRCKSFDEMLACLEHLEGNLTATVHAAESDHAQAAGVLDTLRDKVGRVILNGYPTGVEVVHAMQHGGPYPATTAPGTTSVGMTAIKRFMRPVAFQNVPDDLLPDALRASNPLNIWRIVDNQYSRD